VRRQFRPKTASFSASHYTTRMSDPIQFFRSFQSLLRERSLVGVLTSGMACVVYGLQQTAKDTDWIVDCG